MAVHFGKLYVPWLCLLPMSAMFLYILFYYGRPESSGTSNLENSVQLYPVENHDVLVEKQDQRTEMFNQSIRWEQIFDFVPYTDRNCKSLFKGQNKTLSALYNAEFVLLNAHIRQGLWKILEGHSGESIEKTMTYWRIANQTHVHTICETGFNAGHSTLTWLMANPKTKVYSFDIAKYEYTQKLAEYLKSRFPDRLTTIFGDSTVTLPKFIKEHSGFKCDIVVVDGGHSEAVGTADIKNMQMLANHKHNILVYDDYPKRTPQLAPPWELRKRKGEIGEIFYCTYENSRSFTVGRFLYH